MKKQYLNPKTKVVKIKSPNILAGSPGLGENYDGGTILSRKCEMDCDFDFDEE